MVLNPLTQIFLQKSSQKRQILNQKKITEVGSLSAAAAHELSTPLNTIFLILNDLLKEQKLQLSGCVEECLIDVGKMLGAKQVVMGSVGEMGGLITLSAKLVDAESGELIRTSNYDAVKGLSELIISGLNIVALELANKAIKMDTENAAAYVNRGMAKEMLRDLNGACDDWKKAYNRLFKGFEDLSITAEDVVDIQASDASTGKVHVENMRIQGDHLASTGTLKLDPGDDRAITGLVQILGNLQVDGTTTTVNSNTQITAVAPKSSFLQEVIDKIKRESENKILISTYSSTSRTSFISRCSTRSRYFNSYSARRDNCFVAGGSTCEIFCLCFNIIYIINTDSYCIFKTISKIKNFNFFKS